MFCVFLMTTFYDREAKTLRAEQIKQGEPTSDLIEVRLPMAEPEAFELLLQYIYTDRINCALICSIQTQPEQLKKV